MQLHGFSLKNGGGGGIRTLEAGFGPPTRFPGVRLKPLGHSSKLFYMAERVGFEPTRRGNRLPDFESGSFGQAQTPLRKPMQFLRRPRSCVNGCSFYSAAREKTSLTNPQIQRQGFLTPPQPDDLTAGHRAHDISY